MKRACLLAFLLPSLAHAAPVERRLHASRVDASSFLWNDWNKFQENYHPTYLADDDPKTAWVEGAKGSGKGEWVRIAVTPMEKATQVRLKIRNGYQKSKSLFAANARLKDVTIKLLPSGKAQKALLTDKDGWQEVVVAQPAGPLSEIEIAVDSVYEGKKYEDLCLSDVQVLVTAESRDNPAFEKEKLKKILGWKGDRAKAAKLFKSTAAKSIPLLPQYRVKEGAEGPVPSCTDDKCLALAAVDALGRGAPVDAARDMLKGGFKDLRPVQVAPTDRRPIPRVDGFYLPTSWDVVEGLLEASDEIELPLLGSLGALRAEGLGAFDVKDAPTIAAAMAAEKARCKRESSTYAWAKRARMTGEGPQAGKESVRALLVVQCGRVELRDGTEPFATWQLSVYDDLGQLALVAGPGYASTFEWKDGAVESARRVSAHGGKELVVQAAR
jgi:hypothetical protein